MTPKEKAKDIFDKFAFEKTPEGYKMFQTSHVENKCQRESQCRVGTMSAPRINLCLLHQNPR
jgi:hypothetical protein